ncbi:transcriptional regulator, AraC family [Campylobacter blaseri]|uniref:Integron-associated effector binding protein domain-containing protein n=1 Tax=Campylobacter blaseri TaxID=2042961 RepID=A0A2P8R0K2_9BACT|nr:effector binding domain-containing protein [Campylobacter blaseri]PSM52018.1 hypothetical protein CQ405_05500 [Campylobacter blaseri]PSM53803.1 hypothetical protein CRN67_05500 [Campylobacter blaseri]QKF85645.1 transcriptional regulator, AraC family [Campylobacter blaseri]
MKQIILKNSFNIVGFKTTTNNKDELNNVSKISKLWNNFFSSEISSLIKITYGVYFNYQNMHLGDYDILVGIEDNENSNFENVVVQSGKYMVLKRKVKFQKL